MWECYVAGLDPTDADEIRALGEVALRHDLWIVADEMCERMTYGGQRFVSVASLSKGRRARTNTANGPAVAH